MKEQAILLLSQNFSPAQVAAKLGVTESYISQFMAETEFANKVAHAKLNTLQSYTDRDQKYDKIEDILLDKLLIASKSVHRTGDILKALFMVNKAERRGATSHEIAKAFQAEATAIVALEIPAIMRTKFKTNSNNEVIEINSRPLITADSRLILTEQLNKPKEIQNMENISKTEVDL
jgi:transcriptional regulator with XRE-family HTH domain